MLSTTFQGLFSNKIRMMLLILEKRKLRIWLLSNKVQISPMPHNQQNKRNEESKETITKKIEKTNLFLKHFLYSTLLFLQTSFTFYGFLSLYRFVSSFLCFYFLKISVWSYKSVGLNVLNDAKNKLSRYKRRFDLFRL
jgi:hypothetical protein